MNRSTRFYVYLVAIQGDLLWLRHNNETYKIFKFYDFFELLQNSGVEPVDPPYFHNDYNWINFEGATCGPQHAGNDGTVRAPSAVEFTADGYDIGEISESI